MSVGLLRSSFCVFLVWKKKWRPTYPPSFVCDWQEEEVLRLELEKKYVIFARREKNGEESTMTEKTKAIIKNLQTRKHVASQAVDAAVVNIQRLRDVELYPQLLELLLV
jgi:hypothetical protein